MQVSDETRELVDREVRRIVEACYDRARRMLAANRDRLESLTQALLEHETLDEDDAYRAAGFDRAAMHGGRRRRRRRRPTAASREPGRADRPETPPALPPAT